jgi:hypothetical protein
MVVFLTLMFVSAWLFALLLSIVHRQGSIARLLPGMQFFLQTKLLFFSDTHVAIFILFTTF